MCDIFFYKQITNLFRGEKSVTNILQYFDIFINCNYFLAIICLKKYNKKEYLTEFDTNEIWKE